MCVPGVYWLVTCTCVSIEGVFVNRYYIKNTYNTRRDLFIKNNWLINRRLCARGAIKGQNIRD